MNSNNLGGKSWEALDSQTMGRRLHRMGEPLNRQTAVLNVQQMGEADRLSVAAGVDTNELMENAGRAVKSEIEQRWSSCSVVVLCGPGNNGGDGFVAARLLAEAGWLVRIALLGPRSHLKGAARHHADLWRGAVEPLTPAVLDGAELVVDALFGAGLSRALEGVAAETLTAAANRGLPIVAVDVPSGLMGDTGEVLGAVAAVLTVTFFRKKPGHLLLPGRSLCGEVVVADIGTPASVLEQIVPGTFENDPRLWIAELPRPHDAGNKYDRGCPLTTDNRQLL
jgi:ADP-dependent NAD(P)H-hydrate dehydratase / NAD(P)H-hydrate epimerase